MGAVAVQGRVEAGVVVVAPNDHLALRQRLQAWLVRLEYSGLTHIWDAMLLRSWYKPANASCP